jgi:hypothetical protein
VNGRRWTQRDTETVKQMYWYSYDHEIAQATGHCVDTVQRRRSALGLSAYHGPRVRYGTFAELPLNALKAIRLSCAQSA